MSFTLDEFLKLSESIQPYWRDQIRIICGNFREYIKATDSPKIHIDIYSESRSRIQFIIRNERILTDDQIKMEMFITYLIKLHEPEAYREVMKSNMIITLKHDGGR